jgi:hypothetical protein
VLRNCVTAALNRARTLKPFVACRDLIIVIPLCAWERIRVMTIERQATDRECECSSRVTPAPFPVVVEERGGACG